MIAIPTSIRTETPLAISVRRGAGNDYDTLNHIPGIALRGALAKSYLDNGGLPSDSDFRTIFLSGAVRFQDHRIQDAIPWPASTFECADHPSEHVRSDLLLWASTGGSLRIKCHCSIKLKRPTGFAVSVKEPDPNPFIRQTVNLNRRAHSQIDSATLRVTAGRFHTSITIDPGQTFFGKIQADEDAAPVLRKLLHDAGPTFWLGRGRSRGQGRITLGSTDSPPPTPLSDRILCFNQNARDRYPAFQDKVLFSCTFLSPCILYDEWLFSTNQLEHQHVLSSQPRFDRLFHFSSMINIPGWNAAAGLPRPDAAAIAPGSSFLFARPSSPDRLEADVAELAQLLAPLEQSGIGERLNEGFGEVVFCHPIHSELAR